MSNRAKASDDAQAYALKRQQQIENARKLREDRKNGVVKAHSATKAPSHYDEENEDTYNTAPHSARDYRQTYYNSKYDDEEPIRPNPLKPIVSANQIPQRNNANNSNAIPDSLGSRKGGPLVKKLPWEIDNNTYSNPPKVKTPRQLEPISKRNQEAEDQYYDNEYDDRSDSERKPSLSLLKAKTQAKRKVSANATTSAPSSAKAKVQEPPPRNNHATRAQQQAVQHSYQQHRQQPIYNRDEEEDDHVLHDDIANEDTEEETHSYRQAYNNNKAAAPNHKPQTPRVNFNNSNPSPSIPEEYEEENANMVECRDCGRKFAENRLAVHAKICKKVFQSKRKVFDSTKARVLNTEAAKFLGKIKKEKETPEKKPEIKKQSKWKREHDSFMAAIRAARGDEPSRGPGGGPPPPVEIDDSLVPCPLCGRRFNETAAERHIPICKTVFGGKKNNNAKGNPARGAVTRTQPQQQQQQQQAPPPRSNNQQPSASRAPARSNNQPPAASNNSYAAMMNNNRNATVATNGPNSPYPTNGGVYQPKTTTTTTIASPSPKKLNVNNVKSRVNNGQDTSVCCPHCSRKFEKHAAERHVPICAQVQNKPKQLLQTQKRR